MVVQTPAGGTPAGGSTYLDEFESLNAASRISDWAAKEGGAALNVCDRILLGNAYLANPMSAESLLRAKCERK